MGKSVALRGQSTAFVPGPDGEEVVLVHVTDALGGRFLTEVALSWGAVAEKPKLGSEVIL